MGDAPTIPLPWTQDPAFQSWYDRAAIALGAAIAGVAAGKIPIEPTWWAVPAAIAGDFVVACHRIFLRGPELFRAPEPAPAPVQQTALEQILGRLDALEKAIKPPAP